jgi:hypothetical protein|tara:strand:+ start:908 stop:1072 length:165 start_codon:yes stop_codon:yes gene_type:complete
VGAVSSILYLLKNIAKQIKKWFHKKTKVVIVYSADTNRIDKEGGPYRVKVKKYD